MNKQAQMILALIFSLILMSTTCVITVAAAPSEKTPKSNVVASEATTVASTTQTTTVTETTTETTTVVSTTSRTATTTQNVTTTINNQTGTSNSGSIDLFARLIYCEAGGCSYRHKQLVGAVVINRVNSPKFPNTLNGVIYQSGQYAPAMNGKINRVTPDGECYEIARYLLANGSSSICPSNVLFQANFRQGTGVYEVIQSPYGTTSYFCYG